MVRHYTNHAATSASTRVYPLGQHDEAQPARERGRLPDARIHDASTPARTPPAGPLSIFQKLRTCSRCAGDEVTLQSWPARRAIIAVRCIQEYFRERGEAQRTRIVCLIRPRRTRDAAMAGFEIVEVLSTEDGRIDLQRLRRP